MLFCAKLYLAETDKNGANFETFSSTLCVLRSSVAVCVCHRNLTLYTAPLPHLPLRQV